MYHVLQFPSLPPQMARCCSKKGECSPLRVSGHRVLAFVTTLLVLTMLGLSCSELMYQRILSNTGWTNLAWGYLSFTTAIFIIHWILLSLNQPIGGLEHPHPVNYAWHSALYSFAWMGSVLTICFMYRFTSYFSARDLDSFNNDVQFPEETRPWGMFVNIQLIQALNSIVCVLLSMMVLYTEMYPLKPEFEEEELVNRK